MMHLSPLAYLGSFFISLAQPFEPDPVHFSFSARKLQDKVFEIHLSAITDPGWHIYAQEQPAEAVAQPTKIVFEKNPMIVIEGAAKEIGDKERYEDKHAGILQYQYAKVDFVQPITIKAKVKTILSGSITYQSCTNEKCLPPKTVHFSIPIH